MESNYFCVCLVKSSESPEVTASLFLAGPVLMHRLDIPGEKRRLAGVLSDSLVYDILFETEHVSCIKSRQYYN